MYLTLVEKLRVFSSLRFKLDRHLLSIVDVHGQVYVTKWSATYMGCEEEGVIGVEERVIGGGGGVIGGVGGGGGVRGGG